jgi:hypothetical protein
VLTFVCRCGAKFADLGAFLDHAQPCHEARAAPAVPAPASYAAEQRQRERERQAERRAAERPAPTSVAAVERSVAYHAANLGTPINPHWLRKRAG